MSALEHIRQMIDRAESPEPDIAEALDAARRLLDPTLPQRDRELWNVVLENSIGIAISNGYLYGPKLVRSAVELQGRARADAADRFGKAMAERLMADAGFTKEDFELTDMEIRQLIERELKKHFGELRAEVYETLGLPVPEDEDD